MFTRIVVPLDGSQVASRALGYAVPFAEQFGAALTLVGVLVPTQAIAYTGDITGVLRAVPREASGEAETTVTEHLESIAAPLRARGIACDIAVPRGNAAEEIIAEAGDAPGTLIVMSTHGRAGFQRWRLGSVAQHVMRHAAVPTFVVRTHEGDVSQMPPRIAEITVTLDGSLFAEKALPAATALADAFGVPLVLFTVLEEITFPPSRENPEFPDLAIEAERASTESLAEYLALMVARTTTPTRPVRSVAWDGTARRLEEDISEYLAERPPGIVVIASHGRGGILRWAMGSTAEGMLARSPQPVLVIRSGTAMP